MVDDAKAARLREIAAILLPDDDDASALAKRVRGIEQGLSAEDEFSVILAWLGKCTLVHKLDQVEYPPGAKGMYRVPDLLAVFEYEGRQIPVLVEVKKSNKPKLSWRPDYIGPLRAYSELVGLPLLVAWKQRTFWWLTDIGHFQIAKTNYHLPYEVATTETLMCKLAGDFSFKFKAGTAINLRIRKLEPWDAGSGRGEIEEAYFTDKDGARLPNAEWASGLMACFGDESHFHEDEEYVHQVFQIPEGGESQFAHRALECLLTIFRGKKFAGNWLQYISEKKLPETIQDIEGIVSNLRQAGYMGRVFKMKPKTIPSFLADHTSSRDPI
jgi:hypothetical protein